MGSCTSIAVVCWIHLGSILSYDIPEPLSLGVDGCVQDGANFSEIALASYASLMGKWSNFYHTLTEIELDSLSAAVGQAGGFAVMCGFLIRDILRQDHYFGMSKSNGAQDNSSYVPAWIELRNWNFSRSEDLLTHLPYVHDPASIECFSSISYDRSTFENQSYTARNIFDASTELASSIQIIMNRFGSYLDHPCLGDILYLILGDYLKNGEQVKGNEWTTGLIHLISSTPHLKYGLANLYFCIMNNHQIRTGLEELLTPLNLHLLSPYNSPRLEQLCHIHAVWRDHGAPDSVMEILLNKLNLTSKQLEQCYYLPNMTIDVKRLTPDQILRIHIGLSMIKHYEEKETKRTFEETLVEKHLTELLGQFLYDMSEKKLIQFRNPDQDDPRNGQWQYDCVMSLIKIFEKPLLTRYRRAWFDLGWWIGNSKTTRKPSQKMYSMFPGDHQILETIQTSTEFEDLAETNLETEEAAPPRDTWPRSDYSVTPQDDTLLIPFSGPEHQKVSTEVVSTEALSSTTYTKLQNYNSPKKRNYNNLSETEQLNYHIGAKIPKLQEESIAANTFGSTEFKRINQDILTAGESREMFKMAVTSVDQKTFAEPSITTSRAGSTETTPEESYSETTTDSEQNQLATGASVNVLSSPVVTLSSTTTQPMLESMNFSPVVQENLTGTPEEAVSQFTAITQSTQVRETSPIITQNGPVTETLHFDNELHFAKIREMVNATMSELMSVSQPTPGEWIVPPSTQKENVSEEMVEEAVAISTNSADLEKKMLLANQSTVGKTTVSNLFKSLKIDAMNSDTERINITQTPFDSHTVSKELEVKIGTEEATDERSTSYLKTAKQEILPNAEMESMLKTNTQKSKAITFTTTMMPSIPISKSTQTNLPSQVRAQTESTTLESPSTIPFVRNNLGNWTQFGVKVSSETKVSYSVNVSHSDPGKSQNQLSDDIESTEEKTLHPASTDPTIWFNSPTDSMQDKFHENKSTDTTKILPSASSNNSKQESKHVFQKKISETATAQQIYITSSNGSEETFYQNEPNDNLQQKQKIWQAGVGA